jgi:hypothetical protein
VDHTEILDRAKNNVDTYGGKVLTVVVLRKRPK